MDKKIKFMCRVFALTAIASAIVFVIVGATSPIEAGMSVFGHWLKTFFMWCWVTAIAETLMYTAGQVAYHWADDYKALYGNRWFIEGVRADFRYIREQVTWKKVLKYVLIYVGFFAVCLGIFAAIECLVP